LTPPRLDVRAWPSGSRPAGRGASQVGLGQRASRTRTIETSIAPCQWGTAVKGSRPVGGLDYTHAHVDAREGDPVPEVSAGVGRPRRGAPLRSGRGAGTQGSLREPGHPDPAAITPGALGLSVQRRLPGRGGRARPGERGRAEPAPALPPRLLSAYATAPITASSARSARASAAGSRVPRRSRGVWYVSNGTGRRIKWRIAPRTGLQTNCRKASAFADGTRVKPYAGTPRGTNARWSLPN